MQLNNNRIQDAFEKWVNRLVSLSFWQKTNAKNNQILNSDCSILLFWIWWFLLVLFRNKISFFLYVFFFFYQNRIVRIVIRLISVSCWLSQQFNVLHFPPPNPINVELCLHCAIGALVPPWYPNWFRFNQIDFFVRISAIIHAESAAIVINRNQLGAQMEIRWKESSTKLLVLFAFRSSNRLFVIN